MERCDNSYDLAKVSTMSTRPPLARWPANRCGRHNCTTPGHETHKSYHLMHKSYASRDLSLVKLTRFRVKNKTIYLYVYLKGPGWNGKTVQAVWSRWLPSVTTTRAKLHVNTRSTAIPFASRAIVRINLAGRRTSVYIPSIPIIYALHVISVEYAQLESFTLLTKTQRDASLRRVGVARPQTNTQCDLCTRLLNMQYNRDTR